VTAQVSQFGDMGLVNSLSGAQTLTAGTSGPTWTPGAIFYSTSNNAFQAWNPVTPGWANTNPQLRYLALLTADPVAGGAVNLSDTSFIECSTLGYARVPITFAAASAAYPSNAANNSVLTFTMTSTMLVPVGWAALVTASSGNGGLFLASWILSQAYQVNASQSIQVGIGQLVLQGN
jgi:hypothetical protein